MTAFSVGRIDFINTVPIYHGIDTGRIACPGRTVKGSPAKLNRLLETGDIQISSISSVAYARAFPRWLLLPSLSISARGPVRSVLLCLKEPLETRTPTRIGLTNKSATSQALTRIFLENFHGLRPDYQTLDLTRGLPADLDGFLVIGDEAFLLPGRDRFPYRIDLGTFWQDWQHLPFVFGLYAVNRSFAEQHPDETAAVARALCASRDLGLQAVEETARTAADRSGVPQEICRDYLRHIEYGLTREHVLSLERFFEILQERSELDPGVTPAFFEPAGGEQRLGQ